MDAWRRKCLAFRHHRANRPKPPAPGPAPRRPPYRPAGCAGRAKSRTTCGSDRSAARSVSSNPPSGPINTAKAVGRGAAPTRPRPGLERPPLRRKRSSVRSAGHAARSAASFTGAATSGTARIPHCSAASMTLARIRSMLSRSRLGTLGQDRLKDGSRPSRQPFAPYNRAGRASAARTDNADRLGASCGRTCVSHVERGLLLGGGGQSRPPLAVAPVENEQFRAIGKTQYVAQIMRLPAAEDLSAPRPEAAPRRKAGVW